MLTEKSSKSRSKSLKVSLIWSSHWIKLDKIWLNKNKMTNSKLLKRSNWTKNLKKAMMKKRRARKSKKNYKMKTMKNPCRNRTNPSHIPLPKIKFNLRNKRNQRREQVCKIAVRKNQSQLKLKCSKKALNSFWRNATFSTPSTTLKLRFWFARKMTSGKGLRR